MSAYARKRKFVNFYKLYFLLTYNLEIDSFGEKYLIFLHPCSDNKAKRGELRYSTCNVSGIQWKVGNGSVLIGTECLKTLGSQVPFAYSIMNCIHSVKLKKNTINKIQIVLYIHTF